MCLATDYLSRLKEIKQEIVAERRIMQKNMSVFDKKLSKHYHDIEVNNYDKEKAFEKIIDMQIDVQKRRILKHEMDGTKLVLDQINSTIGKVEKLLDKLEAGNNAYTENFNINKVDVYTEILS